MRQNSRGYETQQTLMHLIDRGLAAPGVEAACGREGDREATTSPSGIDNVYRVMQARYRIIDPAGRRVRHREIRCGDCGGLRTLAYTIESVAEVTDRPWGFSEE
jgi:hypothetical protein